jgi:membrane protease subunit HflK
VSDQHPGQEPHDHAAEQTPETGPSRAASVQLRRRDERVDNASLMDPANQSLAEALRITFRLLQLAMFVLVVLYIGSGFQSVKANERGVRLVFGDVAAQDLRPGFHFSAPYPIGELVKVDVGNKELNIDRMFWPYVEPGRENQGADQLRQSASLSPDQDGFLLTADGAIAHTQWRVQYSRADASRYASSVYPEHETGMIRAAVQRGIVRAIAEVEIDALLKQGVSEDGSVALRARAIAQRTLQEMGVEGTGLEIQQLSLSSKIPPAYLRDAFNSVLEAASNASKAREDAQREGNTALSEAAGGAAPLLIDLINRYERLIDEGDEAGASETLALVDLVFEGRPVVVDGAEHNPPVGGRVAQMMFDAERYRSTVVDQAKSDLALFQAKLQQFRTNPTVMVAADWTDALGSLLNDQRVEVFFNPPGIDTLEVLINRDPELRKEQERRMRAQQAGRARDEREQNMERDRYRTQEGLSATPG